MADNSMEGIAEVDVAAAEAAKNAGNDAFKGKHYTQALDKYSEAIRLNPSNAVYYANRAFAHMKLESYGAAVEDATKALEIDPKYIKGYYRRGDANFALGKFKLALKDLRTAAKVSPNDPDLRAKLASCEREVKRLRFEEALASPETEHVWVSSTLDLSTMEVEDSYKGPRMEGDQESGYRVTQEFVSAMMETFKEQNLIHKRFAFEIVLQVQSVLRALPSLVDIPVAAGSRFTVCGDVHGQYYDLMRIFELNGQPAAENPYLFNGDFVDRGSFSVEVILTLFAFKLLLPESFHLTRGNHEAKSMNKIYGFDGEVRAKFNSTLVDVFRETFCCLPLAFVLAGASGRVLVLHGGLFSRDDVTLDEIREIDRIREPPEEGVMCEALWSDPGDLPGRQPSKRGVGVAFGADVTQRFLERNNLDLVVRSHEVKEGGYEVTHGGRLVTVFSAPNYCDQMGNKGAFVVFKGDDMVPHFTTFEAAPHPDVRPMKYANSFLMGM